MKGKTTRRSFLIGTTALTLASQRGMTARLATGGGLQAGAAAVDITPDKDVRLDGTIMRIGPVQHIHDRLYARALVLDDGRERIGFCVCDATMISREIFDRAKRLVRKRIGLQPDRMLFAATHTHMAPRSVALGLGSGNDRYEDSLAHWVADAVCQATARLAPAKIGWGVIKKPEYVHNRRWIMKPGTIGPNPFGETTDQVVMGGRPLENRVKTAGPADPDLSILSIQHADGRPLAVLGNYSIHYVAYKRGEVSADYFGAFAVRCRQQLASDEKGPNFVGMMTNGTSGDIGSPGGGFEKIRAVGYDLAEAAVRLIRAKEHHSHVTLAMQERDLELGVRLPDEKRLAWAKAVQAGEWAKPAHGWYKIYAHNVLKLAAFPRRVSVKLQAVRIGGLGIVASPCEVFAETGLAIKRNSPFKPTFHIQLAGGYAGYLPPAEQFPLGGYTTWPAESSHLEIEAESKIRGALLQLLGKVQGQS